MSISTRVRRAAVALPLAAAAVVTAVDVSPFVSAAHASTTTLSGANGSSAASLGAWRGAPATAVNNYMPHGTWAEMANPTYGGPDGWKGSSQTIEWAVTMLPMSQSGPTIQTGATGAYNHYFTSMAQKLVADGQGTAIIRLGWEMNGDWYRWSAVKDPRSYIAYWRQIVTAMRAVPGAQFRFLWSPAVDVSHVDLTTMYPGDAYVDMLGMSTYDIDRSQPPSNPVARWSDIYNGPNGQWGLKWLAEFGQQHDKPLGFGEWGLSSTCDVGGGGDDPYFIQQMHNYFANNDVTFETYFDLDPTSCDVHTLRSGQFPQAAALYKKLFSQPYAPVSEPTTTGHAATAADLLQVSPNADRSGALALSGADLEGGAYIFATTGSASTSSVSFYLDGATKATHSESSAPFDFVGGSATTAIAWDPSSVPAGTHTMTLASHNGNGATISTTTVSFTTGEPPSTGTSPAPTTSPAPAPTTSAAPVPPTTSPAPTPTTSAAPPAHGTAVSQPIKQIDLRAPAAPVAPVAAAAAPATAAQVGPPSAPSVRDRDLVPGSVAPAAPAARHADAARAATPATGRDAASYAGQLAVVGRTMRLLALLVELLHAIA